MKTRYRLTRRESRGDTFYCVDSRTGQRTSLRTGDATAARRIVEARNQAEHQPALNLQLAKAYPAGTDNGIIKRTWKDAIESLTATKHREPIRSAGKGWPKTRRSLPYCPE